MVRPIAYYNEYDLTAAKWLENLIKAGHIAYGVVDTRSIEDVRPSDLAGFTQCHFFAGIGVWSYALRRAGWADDRPVWTGSCPCQPFSAAGEGAGFADERHLWPAFKHLINERRPAVVLGEQVASKAVDPWIDLVHTDMEAMGYGFGAVAFPSAGVGAPHIRDRTYWASRLGDADLAGLEGLGRGHKATRGRKGAVRPVAAPGEPVRLADTDCGAGRQGGQDIRGRIDGGDAQSRSRLGGGGVPVGLAHSDGGRRPEGRSGTGRGLFDASGTPGQLAECTGPGPTNGFWRDADWLGCRDGKWRPVMPGTFPLVNGAPARVGRLRGYGNAVNAEQARIFIECFDGI